MALTRTDIGLYESAKNIGTAAFTTAAFTPPANSLLVVAVAFIGKELTGDLGTPTISGGGLTYTSRITALGSASWALKLAIFTAPVGGSPASMTITVDDDNNQSIYAYTVSVIAFAGYNTGTPIAGAVSSGSTNIADGEEKETLGATPTAEDVSLFWLAIDGEPGPPNPTLATGWTKIHEGKTGGEGGLVAARRGSSTSTEVKVTDVWTGGTFFKGAMASLIVKAATSEPVDLAGNLAGAGEASGTLTGVASLQGAAAGAGTLTATATGVANLSGSLRGEGTLSGVLAGIANLAASASGTGALAGELATVTNLAGGLTGIGGLAGELAAVATLAGDLHGQGALSAEVVQVIELAANLAGAGNISGELRAVAVLAAELGGVGTLEGSMELAADFSVRIPTHATVDPYATRIRVEPGGTAAVIDASAHRATVEAKGASASVDPAGALAHVDRTGSEAVLEQRGATAEVV